MLPAGVPHTVYLDTNIVSRYGSLKGIKPTFTAALAAIKNNPARFDFYTSKKVKDELDNRASRPEGVVYTLFQRVPEKNYLEGYSSALGSAPLGAMAFGGGGGSRESPLYTFLKTIFDPDDAQHIFQAESNGVQYFLTLDEKTILNRAKANDALLTQRGVRTKFVSPVDVEALPCKDP